MMRQYVIEVDDTVIEQQITNILNDAFRREMLKRYDGIGGEVRQAVKDLIYQHKEEILERVIDRASKELVRKGLPALLERMDPK